VAKRRAKPWAQPNMSAPATPGPSKSIADLDGKLQAGEIEVYSDLGASAEAEYGAGSLTRRIFPKGSNRLLEPPRAVEPVPEPELPHGAPTVAADSAPTVATPRPPATSDAKEGVAEKDEEDGTKGRAFAYIRYVDQQARRLFEVTKSQMVIGRGGRSYWVDLKVETLPDVSREHCRIRRDPETGRFTIEDVSQFGTAVNGKPVGRNATAELPRRATISWPGFLICSGTRCKAQHAGRTHE